MSVGRHEQRQARIHNELRAFVCRWYSTFDKGASVDALLPHLPDEDVEFVYPGRSALTRVPDLTAFAEQTAQAVKRTSHSLGDVHVRELEDGLYEALCAHTYQAIPRGDAARMALRLVGRMRIRLGQKTRRDPEGARPKLFGYKVTPVEEPVAATLARGETPGAQALFSENDVKAFVYDWFALIDAGDSAALSDLVVQKDLDVDILGSRSDDAHAFGEFLLVQKEQQRWSAHVPLDLAVEMKSPTEATVRFLLRFDGELTNGARLQLSNLTTWQLRLESERLRLRSYRLAIL